IIPYDTRPLTPRGSNRYTYSLVVSPYVRAQVRTRALHLYAFQHRGAPSHSFPFLSLHPLLALCVSLMSIDGSGTLFFICSRSILPPSTKRYLTRTVPKRQQCHNK